MLEFLPHGKVGIYPKEVRSFAVTLHFYSPRAYEYVRSIYKTLPSQRIIRKWYESIDGSPGFTTEALMVLKLKTTEAAEKNQKVVCNLVMDEIYIKKFQWPIFL